MAVSLREFGADRIEIIRAVREVTDLGLREARALVNDSPAQVAAWSHDTDADTDADGPEGAGDAGQAQNSAANRRRQREVAHSTALASELRDFGRVARPIGALSLVNIVILWY